MTSGAGDRSFGRRPSGSGWRAGRRLLIIALIATALASSAARAAPDAPPAPEAGAPLSGPDQQAREAFGAQRYPDALAIYQRLRAETGHPTYLRNIGRCHQMMRQPRPAIEAFESYLREAHVEAGERAEIEGYIAEMRRLELTTAPADSATAPAGTAATSMPAAATLTTTPATASDHSSILRKWWFWAGAAAVVTVTSIIVIASSGQDRLPCPSGAVCP
ncbi:MAG TPA: hypothetical protein VHM31_18515 [Polyangia bacterium]|nr:hypothetical protein [Polyangia bacterium]